MRRSIRLSESSLHRIIKESVRRILNEEYRDLGNTSGLVEFDSVFRIYNELKTLLFSKQDEWDFLHGHIWYKFFNKLKTIPQQMKFYTEYKGNANQDVSEEIDLFVQKCQTIPYPDLSVTSNSSFVEKAQDVKRCLLYAYKLYDGFINFLVSKHEDEEMKQKDIDSDWSNFEKNRQKFNDDTRKKADTASLFRRIGNPWGISHKRGALERYDLAANPEKEGNKEYHDWLFNDQSYMNNI